ncbi:MAG: hypothetical protein Kow00108_20550 [Calditrichia bacterium]
MKRFINGFAIVILLLGITNLFAQSTDSTKVQQRNRVKIKTQVQVKEKKQVQNGEQAKVQHGYRFVDENGDGYNDNAPDHDGDGIPNGMDPDYDGPKMRKGNQNKNFVDNDGDGINDNMQNMNQNKKQIRQRKRIHAVPVNNQAGEMMQNKSARQQKKAGSNRNK